MGEMILAPLGMQNPFNNSCKDVKFATNLVDAMINTMHAFDNIFHNSLIHKLLPKYLFFMGNVKHLIVKYSCLGLGV